MVALPFVSDIVGAEREGSKALLFLKKKKQKDFYDLHPIKRARRK
jgi:hypothetical protein